MGAAACEPDVWASCHRPLLSQLYFLPLGEREGEGLAASGARPARRLRHPPVMLLE